MGLIRSYFWVRATRAEPRARRHRAATGPRERGGDWLARD